MSFKNDCQASTEQLIDNVIYASTRIGQACEQQNIEMKAKGYDRCPTNTCLSSFEVGGLQAPVMDIKIQNGTGSSSFGYSSYSSTTGTSRRNADLIFVTVGMKFSLAKDPDKIICVNPLSPSSIDRVQQEIVKLNERTNYCGTL